MRLLLRCDATASGGVGHLVRCVAVAEAAVARGWHVVVAGNVQVPFAARMLEELGIDVVTPPSTAQALASLAAELGADVLHVDTYEVEPSLASYVDGPLLSSIEDGVFGRRPADVVIDPTPGASPAERDDDGSGTLLLGVAYAPMRSSVRRLRARVLHSTGRRSGVLVVMGGTDAFGAAADAVRLAASAGASGLTVVSRARDTGALVAGAGAVPLRVLEPRGDLLDVATEHEVVITAAGTSVWELGSIGVPTGMIWVTENQARGYEAATASGIAVGLGGLDEIRTSATKAIDSLRGLLESSDRRAELSTRSRRLVDGEGAGRIVDTWVALLGSSRVAVRQARSDDSMLLFEWRNHPSSRAASRSTDELDVADHERWLAATLGDPDRVLYIAEEAGRPVGTVRFDREGQDLVEVSLALAPYARGQGLARPVLLAAEAELRNGSGPMPSVRACIRPENEASIRLFSAGGYERVDQERADGLLTFVRA